MEQEHLRLRAVVPRSQAWLVIGPSSEQLVSVVPAFIGHEVSEKNWTSNREVADDNAVMVFLSDGHWWVDGEAVRQSSLESWRKFLSSVSEGTTLDLHLDRGCRWIILRGLELLSSEQLSCLAEHLGRGGRGWLLLAAAHSFPSYRRIAQLTTWWLASPDLWEKSYRPTLSSQSTMATFSATWSKFMAGKVSMPEMDDAWLQLIARDVSWNQCMSLLCKETLRHADLARAKVFFDRLLQIERKPRQRDIFTWRWVLHLAHETFSGR